MDMQAVLVDLELDIQELKYLMEAFAREPNGALREVLRRNILRARNQLEQMLSELDSIHQPTVQEKNIELTASRETMKPEPISKPEDEKVEVKRATDTVPILGESLKLATDLRRLISLNDSFRFSRELFNGDVAAMNRIVEQISEMSSLDMAMAFLSTKVSVNEENEVLIDFQELLKKYFN